MATKDQTFAKGPLAIEPLIASAPEGSAPSKEQALEIVRLAIASRDLKSINTFFRKGWSTDTEILRFLEDLEPRDGAVESYDWLSNMDRDGMSVEGVLVSFVGKEKPVERIAFLTPNQEGAWQVDFDAFARITRPAWNEFLEKGAQQATVRVFMTEDVYYNGPFNDESQWICYGMTTPENDVFLHGYCRIGSKQAEDLERIFAEGSKVSRATLELQRVKDAGARQFEITQVHSRDWLLTESKLTSF